MDIVDGEPAGGPGTFIGDRVNGHGTDFNRFETVNQQRDLATEKDPGS